MAEKKIVGIKTTELDKTGRELAKLKAQKSKLEAEGRQLTPKITKLTEKYIGMLLKADQDSWVIKGVGRLSLTTKNFVSVKDYKQFLKWAKSAKAKKLGVSLAVIDQQTNIKLTKESGLGVVLNEFKAEVLGKNPDYDFEKNLGVSFSSKSNVSYAPKATKKK